MLTQSYEGAFWAMKDEARIKGINPARMGQLAKVCNDFRRAQEILQQTLKSKKPSTYLGAVVAKLKADLVPLSLRTEEPEIALHGRLSGWPVRKTVLNDGRPGWWVAGVLYNRDGDDVGA